MNDIMKIAKCLKVSGLSIKDISEKIKNETKEQKGEFFGIIQSTLFDVSLLRSLLTSKCTIRASEDTITAGQDI